MSVPGGLRSGGVAASRARAMPALVEHVEQVGGVLDDYETAIAGVLGRHPNAALFASFPGTGSITTATLPVEIGDTRGRGRAPVREAAD